jgi:hypothetical protein
MALIMSDLKRAVIERDVEIGRLRTLIGDLIYVGSERGYTRGSQRWAEEVRASGLAAGLSEADIQVLTDMAPWAVS